MLLQGAGAFGGVVILGMLAFLMFVSNGGGRRSGLDSVERRNYLLSAGEVRRPGKENAGLVNPTYICSGRVQSSPVRPARLAIVAANLPGSTGFET